MKVTAWDRFRGQEVEVLVLDFQQWYVKVRNPLTKEEYGERCSFNNEITDRFILNFKIQPVEEI